MTQWPTVTQIHLTMQDFHRFQKREPDRPFYKKDLWMTLQAMLLSSLVAFISCMFSHQEKKMRNWSRDSSSAAATHPVMGLSQNPTHSTQPPFQEWMNQAAPTAAQAVATAPQGTQYQQTSWNPNQQYITNRMPVKNWFQCPQNDPMDRHYVLNTNIQFTPYVAKQITCPTFPIAAHSLSHQRNPVPFKPTFQPQNP